MSLSVVRGSEHAVECCRSSVLPIIGQTCEGNVNEDLPERRVDIVFNNKFIVICAPILPVLTVVSQKNGDELQITC